MHGVRTFMRWFAIIFPVGLALISAPEALAATPAITSLSPSNAVAGGPAFTLSINGSHFVSGTTTAKWNSSALRVTYKSASLLTASVTSAQIATAGSATVMVTTPSSLGAILGQGESLEEGGRVTFVFLSGY